ncbi:glycoside hydrolase family 2 TIM barrel-domain containing protein [Enterococcus bulliens]
MNPSIEWLDQPEIFRVGRLDAHSDHINYSSKEMYEQKRSRVQNLDGIWDFCYSQNPQVRPKDFYQTDFDGSSFDTIRVPQHIEFSDYDTLHYINTMYPWEGKRYRRPDQTQGMFSQDPENPVGSYRLTFDLEEALLDRPVRIRFNGVEQAMYIWLNGEFIGYAEDSFTPSEFDLTPFLKASDNLLAVEVYKRSTAAFLEDQDFFRFFGIFRSVELIGENPIHLEDITVKPKVNSQEKTGKVAIELKVLRDEGACYRYTVQKDGHELLQKTSSEKMIEFELSDILLWDITTPECYQVIVEILKDDKVISYTPVTFGFRELVLDDKVMYLNGRRLKLNGVNRHEWNAKSGRVITDEDEQFDIEFMKENAINAVRTSHYPNRLSFYDRCDYAGIYMMAETNLETHGSWQKMGAIEPSWNVPGDYPVWREVTLDRAISNYEWFKNHPSILFWSLGNESFVGETLKEMNAYYKKVDSSRLVHYEGVFYDEAMKPFISDMESRMYASPEEIRTYFKQDGQKPFILCEFMHNMGNSLGGLKEYMELYDEFESYQGGFIWDYIDQAILRKDPLTGQEVLRYGGDFDDRPSDYEFSGNGLLFATRQAKPSIQEVAYYYEKYR